VAASSGETRRRVGFISDPITVLHETGPRHPERPDRLRAIHVAFRQAGLLTSDNPFPHFRLDLPPSPPLAWTSLPLTELPYTLANDQDLLLVHTPEHLAHVQSVCTRAAADDGPSVLDAGDTPVSGRSEEMARRSVGAGLAAVDAVLRGEVDRCFVASRPPGHHAEPDRAMGFCLYSNIAIAARHALARHNLSRVAIVDFDVHHGNGTQACLQSDPHALFISLHQHPQSCYPGTGFEWEIGLGPGKGFTLNIPLPPTAGDKTYSRAMEEKVLPRLHEFKPELLLISAGFDAHADDPLADMELTDDGFAHLTRQLMQAADELCQGKVVSLLEGGYNLPALARSAVRHLIEMQS
jgi:acetoin utilization deacetylase AcuC-like enzyme